jgi:hypothetical protein
MENPAGTADQRVRGRSIARRAKRAVSKLVAKSTETLLPAKTVHLLRVGREWRRWVESLTFETLADLADAPDDVKRRVFKAHVQRVEIETHAKCNRICSFCPNVLVDRRLNQTVTPLAILDRIFEQLGSIDYTGQIVVARYSEPLTNRPYLYECLSRARSAVPHAQLCITTNTDYLKKSVLDDLHKTGLNRLYMSIYLRDHEQWSIELARAYTQNLQKKLGARLLTQVETSKNLLAIYDYKGMQLSSTCHDWNQYGNDRGGSLDQYKLSSRVGPCRDPFETFVVDYNGSVMPCCALRSDLPIHRDFVAGDLSSSGASIFDIYTGRLSYWRRSLAAFGEKDFPCATCRHRDLPVELMPSISRHLERQLQRIGGTADDLATAPHAKSMTAAVCGSQLYSIEPNGINQTGTETRKSAEDQRI